MLFRSFVLVSFMCVLTSCCVSPYAFRNYCAKDYWGDTNFEIFGRESCVGETGHWVTDRNGWDGSYCKSPRCKINYKVNCTDTCCKY